MEEAPAVGTEIEGAGALPELPDGPDVIAKPEEEGAPPVNSAMKLRYSVCSLFISPPLFSF